MTYIILVAGKGTRLHPLTLHYPKSLYQVAKDETILQRMVSRIRKYDPKGEIVVVVGFMGDSIAKEVEPFGVKVVWNPFFNVTNSIASLWFARDFLNRDNVVIIDGDIILEDSLYTKFVCVPTKIPYVLLDSTDADAGDYNAQVSGDKVLVMGKNLSHYYGEYCCLVKLDAASSQMLRTEIEDMVSVGMYDQYFEDALVQMIFKYDFSLFFKDIKGSNWTEVDCTDDLLKAKQIAEDK
jgi:L-glutamine-phosphate cytidylyltransferase